MLKYIKQSILSNKQNAIKRKFPNVSVVLHGEMPNPSVNKVASLCAVVSKINALEPKISILTDEELRQKTAEFRAHISSKESVYARDIAELEESMVAVAIPEEKEKIKSKINRMFIYN